jgi:hypothetical protein
MAAAMNRTAILLAALAAACALPAAAILTRPDRDDEEYRELATRYPATVALGTAEGAGVLVAPRWVLTTASRAVALRDARPAPRVAISGRAHAIQEFVIHPDWKPGNDSDIALIRLREPAMEIEPAPIYRAEDEAGRPVRLVGFGETGRIGGKPAGPSDGKVRAAINTIDRVTALTLGLRIKAPDEASDLQGAAAPGDGGAPAYLEIEERILVAGLHAAAEDTNGDGIRGNVGDWDRLTRVSAFAAWIDAVIARAAADEAAAIVGDTNPR